LPEAKTATLNVESTTAAGASHPDAPAKKLSRIVSLDAWRGLALLLVYVCHCLAATSTVVQQHQWLSDGLKRVGSFGGFGLNFLFVLSGYLITRILVESRHAQHYFRNYYIRRFLRIFPVYYAFLFACLIAGPMIFGRKQFMFDFLHIQTAPTSLWFYGTNIVMTIQQSWCFGYLSHLWSLAVEEHFYFVWPIVIALLAPKRVMQLAFGLIGASTVARLILGFGMHEGIATRVNTLCNMDCIAAGAVVALYMMNRDKEECALMSKRLLWTAGLLFPIFAVASFINTESSAVFCPTLGAIGFSGLVIKTVLDPNSCRLFAHDFMKLVGKYSYGLYLFHYPVIYLIAQHCVKSNWPAVAIFATIALMSWAIVAPIAVLSFHFFETPFLKLKDKFEYFKAADEPAKTPTPV